MMAKYGPLLESATIFIFYSNPNGKRQDLSNEVLYGLVDLWVPQLPALKVWLPSDIGKT